MTQRTALRFAGARYLLAVLAAAAVFLGCGQADPASAAGSTAAICAPGTTAARISVDGRTRQYRLHVPSTARPGVALPLIVAFHGHNNTAAAFERTSGLSALADRAGFLVAYPQGAVGRDGQTGWNTGRAKDPTTNDALFVQQLVARLQQGGCADPRRTYAAGFSNGGGFVAVLACRMAGTFAAFAPVAGDYVPTPGGCHPSRPAPLLEIHGTADGVNPYAGSLRLREASVAAFLAGWTARDGCAMTPRTTRPRAGVTLEVWSPCRGGVTVEHERVAGVGHVWPPAYAAAVWSFFARYAR